MLYIILPTSFIIGIYLLITVYYRNSKFEPGKGEYIIYTGPASQQLSAHFGGNLISHGLITITNHRIHYFGVRDFTVPTFIRGGNIQSRNYYYQPKQLSNVSYIKRIFLEAGQMTSLKYISQDKILIINHAEAFLGKEFFASDFPIDKEITELINLLGSRRFTVRYIR